MAKYIPLSKRKDSELVPAIKGTIQAIVVLVVGFLNSLEIAIFTATFIITIHVIIEIKGLTKKTSGFAWFLLYILIFLAMLVIGWTDSAIII